MAPRKTTAAAAEDADAPAPRRSGRIAGAVADEPVPEPVKAAKPRAPTKKRSTDGADTATKKKVKKDDAEVTEDVAPGEDADPATAKLAPLDVGDVLPSFVLKNEKDEDVDVSTLTQDKGLVLFLVPKADTPGCTNQACAFRDSYPDFSAHNYNVYCLSADTPAALTKWQAKKELPYPLLSDRKRVLIGALGAADGQKTKRSHFVFAQGGKLLDKKVPVKPADSTKLALEFVKAQSA